VGNPEHIEKVRQEIMRFRELLDVMALKLRDGERAYECLFAVLPPETAQLREKDRQTKLAEHLFGNLQPLSRAVVKAQFDAREMERAFEELHGIILTSDADEASETDETD